jgi:polyphosphate kinase
VPSRSERFLNRELSWLEFNGRVLALAVEEGRPLLERAKFLAIFSNNLDEFFQVRVADLQDQVASGTGGDSPDGLSAAEQLALVRARVVELSALAQDTFAQRLRPALAAAGIELIGWDGLRQEEREHLSARFAERIQPILIPLAMDPAHPFPYVSGLSLSVGAFVRRRGGGPERFARVKVPPFLPRWWPVSGGRFVAVEDLVQAHLEELFPEDDILERGHFRVTRDADLELEDRDGNLAETIEASLRRRQRGSDAVRLEADAELSARIRALLVRELRLEPDEVYDASGLLDLGGLWEIHRLDRPDLKDPPWTPRPVNAIALRGGAGELFFGLRERSILVHHPYESFEGSVERFLRAAAEDPAVRVIMSTIYRTGGPESGIVRALEGAASRGKQVVVLVELKARFDEAANLERARALERAGAHVVYGLVGLKTHAKLALVVREEGQTLRRYCHVGTGNYNPITARLYEDVGILTSDESITHDVAELFHRLTSGSGARAYDRLLVAPETLRDGLRERIAREARPGGRIAIKVNSLSDAAIIEALYAASSAGAEIDLIVRGICCLRPGVEGLSERIRVRSIVGRFLEHSRIFRFGTPERSLEYWIGSADLMSRNLDTRVEALVPVDAPALQRRLERILATHLDPDARAWELAPDGSWKRAGGSLDSQVRLSEEIG